MSRDVVDSLFAATVFRLVELVFPTGARVDDVFAENFCSLFASDGDVVFVDEEDDAVTTELSADAKVVHLSCLSE